MRYSEVKIAKLYNIFLYFFREKIIVLIKLPFRIPFTLSPTRKLLTSLYIAAALCHLSHQEQFDCSATNFPTDLVF